MYIAGLHRDPAYWPNPETFDPERWLGGQTIAPGSFLAFGEGPRACLGLKFAEIEIKIAIAHIVSKFHLELVQGQDLEPVSSITSGLKNGLRVNLTPR
eukprot:jgi/Hompol1/3823/HPOL_006764-RA